MFPRAPWFHTSLGRFLFGFLVIANSALHAADSQVDASDHWAFVAPTRPSVPEPEDGLWGRNPIDAFIRSVLEEFELKPAPESDPANLLRRVTFDLTGLPPTPAEIRDFMADPAPDRYERAVDRLLASPHYGERQAQHWLDLARYADTDGFEFDQTRPNIWRYRDWVVSALNSDLPYDRFLALQIAGDEIAPDDPGALLATGFNRCYPDMVDMNDQGERRQIALDDITETTASVFLGLTLGCARCHDHKFDPLLQTDFYELQAVFAPAQFVDDQPLATLQEQSAHASTVAGWTATRTAIQRELLLVESEGRLKLAPEPPPALPRPLAAAYTDPARRLSPEEADQLFRAVANDRRVPSEALLAVLDPIQLAARAELRVAMDVVAQMEPAPLPRARVLMESSATAAPAHLRIRGEYSRPGPEVLPGVPRVLVSNGGNRLDPNPLAQSTGRRAAFTQWLTSPSNPLTARVLVNRLWQTHFGRGIVATPSDFGVMGTPPTHPELLDWLAVEFMSRGWSLKAMHRLIVTSSTYRMSTRHDALAAEIDPENELFWRQNRKRLEGEAIRDAMLFASGQLVPTPGGPPVFPDLPPELARLSSKGEIWPLSSSSQDRNRRSLYVFIRRNLRYPFFEVFDRPDTNASCPRRPVTTIAPQALALLNDPFAHAAATAMAHRILSESDPGPDARIERAYQITLGRSPDPDEIQLSRAFLADAPDETTAWTSLALALFNLNEFVYLD